MIKSTEKIESASRDLFNRIFSELNYEHTQNDERMEKESDDGSSIALVDRAEYKKLFIEIAIYKCGSVFGLGEQMEDRIITAGADGVQCLLIPRYWLLQKKQNLGNIWQR